MKPTLLVFARPAALGEGKTRLAAEMGKAQALRITRFLQARTFRAACDPRWRLAIAAATRKRRRFARSGAWPPALLLDQGGGDLGARLARTFRAFRRGPLAVIGTDAPDVSAPAIAAAFRALRRSPFAIGRAMDGGFWILAARKPRDCVAAFARVRWSSANAAADMIAALPGDVREVRALADIDTARDWRAWRRSRGLSPAPRTGAAR